jgi:hypothetical protein
MRVCLLAKLHRFHIRTRLLLRLQFKVFIDVYCDGNSLYRMVLYSLSCLLFSCFVWIDAVRKANKESTQAEAIPFLPLQQVTVHLFHTSENVSFEEGTLLIEEGNERS